VTKFYNGPSPDEVALVDYACQMKFECIESTDELIKMQMSLEYKKDPDYIVADEISRL
jgi:hypothetical protein